MIGSLGEVVFEVSSESVKTFDDLSMQWSAKYAQHDIHGRKGLLEFTGLAPTSLSLKIQLSSALGIVPKDELSTLRDMLKAGKAVPFVLEGEPQGDGLWVVEDLNENHKVISNTGALLLAEVSLNLKEYVENGDGS
jgi:phage protein U